MKYDEMKTKCDRIVKLRYELEKIEELMKATNFYSVKMNLPGRIEAQIGGDSFNAIMPMDLVKALSIKRKSEIEKEIEELER